MLKINIVLTVSKITAILIFVIASAYSFYTTDASVILTAIPITAGMLGWKSYIDRKSKEPVDVSVTEKG